MRPVEIMRSHIEHFISRKIENDLLENMADNVQLHTPIGTFSGHDGVRNFNWILDEYLPQMTIDLKSVKFLTDRVIYKWKAYSQTASIKKGQCITHFLNNKIDQLWIQCEVDPEVMNQG